MKALAVEKLSVRYGAVEAVRGLSLEVRPGQIVSLIGPNGAGKSSTLHAIMGVAPITGGDVQPVIQGGSVLLYINDDGSRAAVEERVRKAFADVEGIAKIVSANEFADYGIADPKHDFEGTKTHARGRETTGGRHPDVPGTV